MKGVWEIWEFKFRICFRLVRNGRSVRYSDFGFVTNRAGFIFHQTIYFISACTEELGDIRLNSISAGILRAIHRVIRRFNKPLQVVGVPVLGEADADRDVVGFGLLDGGADAFRNRPGPIRRGSDQENGKFVPSVAITRIDIGPDGIFDDFTDCLQNLIAFQMAIEIIVLLEIIEIEHQKGEGGFLAFEAGQFSFQGLEKMPVVIKSG